MRCLCVSLVVLLSPLAAAQQCGATLFATDPVHLIDSGREQPGDPAFTISHGGYTYQFASADTKARFEQSPEKYELQLGGACARMGPLSGRANPELYAVHQGRIYLFASKQCRATFLNDPAALLETDDPKPAADPAALARGRALFDAALAAHGGPAAIDAVRTFRETHASTTEHKGRQFRTDQILMFSFPDAARSESYWGESLFAHSIAGPNGAFWTKDGMDYAMVPAQVRAFRRQMNQHLLTVLKSRTRPDFVAVRLETADAEPAKPAEAEPTKPADAGEPAKSASAPERPKPIASLERTIVWHGGTAVTLTLDPAGRVRSLAFRGRGGPRGLLGQIEHTSTAWETAAGVLLPTAWTTTFDGKPVDTPGGPVKSRSTRKSRRKTSPGEVAGAT